MFTIERQNDSYQFMISPEIMVQKSCIMYQYILRRRVFVPYKRETRKKLYLDDRNGFLVISFNKHLPYSLNGLVNGNQLFNRQAVFKVNGKFLIEITMEIYLIYIFLICNKFVTI